MTKAQYLDWDSNFFEFPISKICIEQDSEVNIEGLHQLLNSEKEKGIQLVYLILPYPTAFSVEELPNWSIKLVDKKIIYHTKLSQATTIDNAIQSYGSGAVSPALLELALASGQYSRFKLDPHFPSDGFPKLYTKWIENSVNKTIAEDVLVFQSDEELKGMVTLGLKNGIGDIGLIAVDSKHRGQKIGQKLVQAAKAFFYNQTISELTVATQLDNKGACNFYERNGFSTKSIENIYHCWL